MIQSTRASASLAAVDRELIETRVREMLRLRALGRDDEADAFYSPGIVLECVGPRAMRPWTGRFEGLEEIRRFRHDIAVGFELLHSEIVDLAVDGAICMLRRRVAYRNRGCGRAFSFFCWEKYEFRDGLAVSLVQQADTVTLGALAGLLPFLAELALAERLES